MSVPLTQADFAAALLDPARAPEGLKAWNGSDPTRRLAVYRNNVVSSLIDALADTFPVVQELVGEEFFRAMASVFVRAHPPRTRVLARYGESFPAFVDDFEHARDVPYLADVARLEIARVSASHAADAAPVAPEAVQAALASGDRIAELRLVCHPSARLVRSRHAVVSIWAAHQGEGGLAEVDPAQPEAALVVRPDLDVLVLPLPAGATAFVAALLDGEPLGAAAEAGAAAEPSFDLPASLSLLMGHAALTSIHLPERPEP